jgi:HD-GYP domain-containing protein (c-di-GMP phosphodiesterase class II)
MIIMTLYKKSPFEEQHSMNVGDLCRSFGEMLRLPEPEVLQLTRAGLVHDIGKICMMKFFSISAGRLRKKKRSPSGSIPSPATAFKPF